MNALYQDLLNQDINNVKIIAIGKEQYNAYNNDWIEGNSIPIVIDPSPYALWTSWSASQRDLYFLDANGDYVEDFNITTWDYNKIYNSIINIISGCTNSESANYNPYATIDDGSCALAIDSPIFPDQYGITSIYPNPFNPATMVSFSIPEFSLVTITAYDLTGRKLKTLANITLNTGNYKIDWKTSSYPSGVYLLRMLARPSAGGNSGDIIQTYKVVLVK